MCVSPRARGGAERRAGYGPSFGLRRRRRSEVWGQLRRDPDRDSMGRYRKAKAEPSFRFYLLYDKIYREDIFRHAYALARANAGAPGTDGMTFAAIEASGLESWLAGLREELISKTYRPDPVRRVMVPKPDGGERPLGIPTIRDRVVQTAAKLVLEPIFEVPFLAACA